MKLVHAFKATYVGIVMLYYVISVINGTPVYVVLSSDCTVMLLLTLSLCPIIGEQCGTSKLAISGWLSQILILFECFFTIGSLPHIF